MSSVMASKRLWGIFLLEVWVKRGGNNGIGNNGPCGYKMRPGPRMYRALAEMASSHSVVEGMKKKEYLVRQKEWMKHGGKHYYENPNARP